jgi:hypothetical protein
MLTERVPLRPMPRNVDAPAYPDPVVALHVIQEALLCAEATGSSKQTAVHAD